MADDFAPAAVADAVLHGLGDAIVACDREGIIRTWNAGAERVFGYAAGEAIGQTLDIIIPERLRARHWEGYDRMMSTGQSRYAGGDTLSVPSMRKDGKTLSIDFTLAALKDAQGNVCGLVAVMRDVTARFEEVKALRRQARASS